jgi:SAM-dependent methyltransferase
MKMDQANTVLGAAKRSKRCIMAARAAYAPIPIEALFPLESAEGATHKFADLFNQYGSDKSSHHNYHLLYGPLLSPKRNETLRLLEIGLGTNNTDVVSHMGAHGKPGASLRAFRDFLPNASVFGADIDRSVLFTEERIRTFYVDQTQRESFHQLAGALGPAPLDLVIDDGLHSPNANIATMIFALEALKPSGTFIVEDIAAVSIPVWQTIAALLPVDYHPTLIQASNGLLFMAKKPR